MIQQNTQIVAVSDIHGEIPDLTETVLQTDLPYIICLVGDILPDYNLSRPETISLQRDWIAEVLNPWLLRVAKTERCEGIVFLGGNHDHAFELSEVTRGIQSIHSKIHYLMLSHVVIRGIKFFGTPITYNPGILGKSWAFGDREPNSTIGLTAMDPDTNVLLSHSPPRGCHDLGFDPITGDMKNMGGIGFKSFLKDNIHHYSQLTDIFCGHIHEHGGNSIIYRVRDFHGQNRRLNVHGCAARLRAESPQNRIQSHVYSTGV